MDVLNNKSPELSYRCPFFIREVCSLSFIRGISTTSSPASQNVCIFVLVSPMYLGFLLFQLQHLIIIESESLPSHKSQSETSTGSQVGFRVLLITSVRNPLVFH